MLEYIFCPKEVLGYFAFMDEKVVSYLVSALFHLIIFNHDVLYYTMLVMHKAMFRREDIVPFAATNFVIDFIFIEK